MQGDPAQRKKHIYLVGFSGSGKSRTGARLAAVLNYRFIDLDAMIADRMHASIEVIFECHGEHRFRAEETRALEHCSHMNRPAVIAVGGGAVERKTNRLIMQQTGIMIYLKCSLRELRRRLRGTTDRPLLRGTRSSVAAVRTLLNRRKPLYETADIMVITSGKPVSHVVKRIADRVAQI